MGHFPRLTAAALDLTSDTYDFTQTITDTLGSLGTSADGFDAYVAGTILSISAEGDLGASLDGDLGLAAGVLSLINPNSLASDVASLPASLAAGDGIVADANALAGVASVVTSPGTGGGGTPPPPPAPTGCDFGGRVLTFGGSGSERYGSPPFTSAFPLLEDDGTPADITGFRILSGDASLITNIRIVVMTAGQRGDPYAGKHAIVLTINPIKRGTFPYKFGVKTVRVPKERTLCGQIVTG